MKKHFPIALFALFFLALPVPAQKESVAKESVFLLTDRNIYVTGERIHFHSHLNGSLNTAASSIIYIELITPTGKQVKGLKYKLENNECSGSFTIPENLLSGNYYLRAYSKYMRNFGPSEFGYCYLKIVNPYKKEVLSEPENPENLAMAEIYTNVRTDNYLTIQLQKDTFFNRETVEVAIHENLSVEDTVVSTIVSVVPEYSLFNGGLRFYNTSNSYNNGILLPAEPNGVTISGNVRSNENEPDTAPFRINLSVLGENKNLFYPGLTDTMGSFFFQLPELYSNHDIFVSVEEKPDASDLLIDNDFHSNEIQLPSPHFILNTEEREAALQLATNEKVRSYFLNTGKSKGDETTAQILSDTIPFYGRPDNTIYIKDFIDMPHLSDYFTELPVPLRVRSSKGERSIFITGTAAELAIYPPLLMVDYLPVYNVEEILNIRPDKVSRFDIVASPYIRGKIVFGGIMNVISKNNDFAGIRLPESGLFLNYQFLEQPDDGLLCNQRPADNLPDPRNTLYWNPRIKLNPDSTTSFTFTTADTKGSYLIRIATVHSGGRVTYSYKKIVVQPAFGEVNGAF